MSTAESIRAMSLAARKMATEDIGLADPSGSEGRVAFCGRRTYGGSARTKATLDWAQAIVTGMCTESMRCFAPTALSLRAYEQDGSRPGAMHCAMP